MSAPKLAPRAPLRSATSNSTPRGLTKLKPVLPSALAKRAAAAAAKRRERLLAEAKDLVAQVRRKRDVISEAFYDIGLALRRLREREMLAALDVRNFSELCETTLTMSATIGAQLVEIVERMTREQAVAMGPTKAAALIALAAATPEADSPADLFQKGRVRLPDGAELDTRTTSARGIERAAKLLREARTPTKQRRGRTTTVAEREYAARLQAAMRDVGMPRATAQAIATKPGQASELRLAGMPLDRLPSLVKAIRNIGKLADGE